jgi:uncharacterized membrane protein
MQIIEQSAVINAPLTAVTAMMHDLESIPVWATVKGTLENRQGQGVGQTYDWQFAVDRFKFKGKIKVVEQTATSLITRTMGDVNSIWTITLTPISPGATAIRVVAEYSVAHALLEPLVDLVIQRLTTPEIARENMNRFKALVEQKAAVAAQTTS